MHRVVLSCIAAACLALALLAAVQLRSPAATAIASGDSQLAPANVAAASAAPTATAPPILAARVTPAWPRHYIVHSGDSLSAIAQREYGTTKKWTNIFWANKTLIKWANVIFAGQHLTIPAPAPAKVAPHQLGPIVHMPVQTRGSDGATATAYRATTASYGNVSPSGYSGFERCVITRESGGNSQVMNSSGHYGLYQFSSSTWAAYGGSAADFGHASPGEQRQVFLNAMAQGGSFNWSPYDGC